MSGTWTRIIEENEAVIQKIEASIDLLDTEEEGEKLHGELWSVFTSDNSFLSLTNFYESELITWHQLMQPHIVEARH